MRRPRPSLALAALLASALPVAAGPVLKPIGTYATGSFNAGAAEIVEHDPSSQRLFFVNGATDHIDVLDISTPSSPTLDFSIDVSALGSPNSVAVKDGVVAVAVEAPVKTDIGHVAFFGNDGSPLPVVAVGALPDMLTFSPDGNWVIVANEGEPSDDYTVDPVGSVSVIDVSGGAANVTQSDVRTAGFTAFDTVNLNPAIRVYGPNASASEDFEPEYVAVSSDSATAWVTIQEANAIAVLDVATATIVDLWALGAKDFRISGHGIDASDQDGAVNVARWPVHGLYEPDAIASYRVGGKSYLVTANEGDTRGWAGYNEELRVSSASVVLDPAAFPNGATLKQSTNLGRLTITKADGDLDGDGDYDALYVPGARSFSIWGPGGTLVYDSGDDFERITAAAYPSRFNCNNDSNTGFDSRSDNKGPEPEAVAIGVLGSRTYAFIGLERIGGVMVYDVTNPLAVTFVSYTNNRDFNGDPTQGTAKDLGPEGVIFIPKSESPIGGPLVVTANEISGTVTIFRVDDRVGF